MMTVHQNGADLSTRQHAPAVGRAFSRTGLRERNLDALLVSLAASMRSCEACWPVNDSEMGCICRGEKLSGS